VCSPLYADTFVKRGLAFSGERWITLVGERRDDVIALERELTHRGFRVSRGIPGVRTQVSTRCVLNISGECPVPRRTRWGDREPVELAVEAFALEPDERVFAARLSDSEPTLVDTEACPDRFFEAVAVALERNWEAPAASRTTEVTQR
jgi:hypothetical protein